MADIFSSPEFEAQFTYQGNDLGATWTKEKTTFRLWAPTAKTARVNLYRSGTKGSEDLISSVPMKRSVNGTWLAEVLGDINGVYYTYLVSRNRRRVEACDPYAKTTGVNGHRAMVIDMASTNPAGWEQDRDPHAGLAFTDAVIAEVHIRDFSMDPSANNPYPGQYLGLIQTGTKTFGGIPTGIDHYKNLGVTHMQMMPMYDYGTVDEAHPELGQYNWGYDPENFNVPEGSYASDPYHGEVRVRELKQMVKGLHDNGISVIMDVVYNHVYEVDNFCFNQIVPNYFSRTNEKGILSNGSCCGNDTASERSMVRKYIVDSVCYWADEYHIDGFRFDLVGLIDTQTIRAVIREVHKTHPNVTFHGEGWSMPTDLTKPDVHLTTQYNSAEVPNFAFFSDTLRDALRGSVFDMTIPGFIAGAQYDKNTLHNCFMGVPFWATNPTQSINYVSCHDNNTLIDRILLSVPNAPREIHVRMNNLAAAFTMTAQGIPFFLAGEEMLRSKPNGRGGLEHNSYKSPDSVNSIKWHQLHDPQCRMTCRYYQGLIAFRKAHPQLRLTTRTDVLETVRPISLENPHGVAFRIGRKGEQQMLAIFNAGFRTETIQLPEGKWGVYVNGESAGNQALGYVEKTAFVEPLSAMILIREV